MTDKIEEQVSALVDGELPLAEYSLLLQRLSADSELRLRWQRYHLIRDALHHELPPTVDCGLADRVRAALESEADLRSVQGMGAKFVKPVLGLAMAASVAGMAVVGLQHYVQSNSGTAGGVQVAASVATPSMNAGGVRWERQRPEMESRLNSYLVNHNAYSSSTNLQGSINYVRISGFEARE